jgi:hypothetical protein
MADIKHRIEIAAPLKVVWPLVSSGTGFAEWWASDVAVAAGEPDVVEIGFFNRATVYRLKAEKLRPVELAIWRCETGREWSGTRIVFALTAREAKTVLGFEHTDWTQAAEYFVSCNTTWGGLMFRLKAAAEGKTPGPLFSATSMAY